MEANIAGRLPLKVKLTYSLGYIGRQLYYLLNSYYLLYFYTNIVGIPGAAAGTIMLIARIWDAVNDPMMGVIVDKTVSKSGKSIFYIKYFSLLTAVIVTISFFCPEINTTGKVIWCAVTYLLQGMATTIINIPYSTLMVRLTDNGLERVRIGQLTIAFGTACNVVVPAITLPLVTTFGGENMVKGFAFTVGLYSVIYFIIMQIVCWGCKGHDDTGIEDNNNTESASKQKSSKISTGQMIMATLKNKYTVMSSIAYLSYVFIAAIMGTSLIYYLKYNVGNEGFMGYFATADGIGCVIAILTMGFMYKKFGNAKTCAIGSLIMALASLMRLILRDNSTAAFCIAILIMGIGGAYLAAHVQQCIMESCTYGKLKYGIDNEASIISFFNFSQKLGQAIGGFIVGVLMDVVPYSPDAEVQADSVLDMFLTQNIIIPLILSSLAVAMFLFITKYAKELEILKKGALPS